MWIDTDLSGQRTRLACNASPARTFGVLPKRPTIVGRLCQTSPFSVAAVYDRRSFTLRVAHPPRVLPKPSRFADFLSRKCFSETSLPETIFKFWRQGDSNP
jgi:hypothetical protein